MPKLLLFLPCERVIVSREGPLSLITLLEGVNITMPPEEYAGLPNDAIIPQLWHVVAKWNREENEEPQHWEQRVQVAAPDGRISTDSVTSFDLAANQSMRNVLAVNGFPIKPLGVCKLTLFLRSAGEDDEAWREIATYPIPLQNVPAP